MLSFQSETKCIHILTARRFPPSCRVATIHVQPTVPAEPVRATAYRKTMINVTAIRVADENAVVVAVTIWEGPVNSVTYRP